MKTPIPGTREWAWLHVRDAIQRKVRAEERAGMLLKRKDRVRPGLLRRAAKLLRHSTEETPDA